MKGNSPKHTTPLAFFERTVTFYKVKPKSWGQAFTQDTWTFNKPARQLHVTHPLLLKRKNIFSLPLQEDVLGMILCFLYLHIYLHGSWDDYFPEVNEAWTREPVLHTGASRLWKLSLQCVPIILWLGNFATIIYFKFNRLRPLSFRCILPLGYFSTGAERGVGLLGSVQREVQDLLFQPVYAVSITSVDN